MSVLSSALLGAVGLVLTASAVSHLRAPWALRLGLQVHGVLPSATHGPVSRLLGPAELLLGGAALLTAAVGPAPGATLTVGLLAAALFLGLTLYLRQVLSVTAGTTVPCACGLGEAPVSPSTVLRAGILSAMAVAGGTTATGASLAEAPAAEAFVIVCAALVLAVSTALLPAARAVPPATVQPRHVSLLRSDR